MEHQRWLVSDAHAPALGRPAWGTGSRRRACGPAPGVARDVRADLSGASSIASGQVDPVVPDLERTHLGELPHPFPIGPHHGGRSLDRLLVVESHIARRDDEACHQPLEVPLPRPRHRLVEIVETEHHVAFRRCEQPEVHQMTIAARLHLQTRRRHCRQIGSHHRGRTPQERERAHRHTTETDRHQILQPTLVRGHQHLDRITTIRRRCPLPMTHPRHASRRLRPSSRSCMPICILLVSR